MNRRLLALPLGMAVAGAAWGQARSADVLYASRGATPVRAFRVGDECFVPIDAAAYWGWKIERNGDVAQVSAEGNTINVPARTVAGQSAIALRRAVQLLGANSEWVATTDTLQVYAPLKELKVVDGRISIKAPLTVKATGFVLSDPNRAVVDLEGARLPEKLDLPKNVRATQFRPNVVRIAVELPYVPVAPGMKGITDREITLDLKPADLPTDPEETKDPVVIKPVEAPPKPTPFGILPIKLLSDANGRTVLQVPLTGRLRGPATFVKRDPSTLEVTLPYVQGALPDGFVSPTPAVMGFEASRRGTATVLVLHLARPMGGEVVASADGVRITLVQPVGTGKLAGKLVIVDPGHGGHDNGARSGGVREKDLTLAVSKLLTDELTKAGATVIMTRKTDVFIPLTVRSDISNRNHADLFIAIHINSTGGSGSQSGTISFHHKDNPTGRLLAECIQAQMAKVNGLPNIGTWSDGRIYASGFSVLRNTRQRAAVLLELGFINHPRDRARMVTEDFQHKIAAAIVKGVRDFLGDPEPIAPPVSTDPIPATVPPITDPVKGGEPR